MNDPTDTYEHMLITAHAFANVLNTEGTKDVVRKCYAMVPVLKEVNRAWARKVKRSQSARKQTISLPTSPRSSGTH